MHNIDMEQNYNNPYHGQPQNYGYNPHYMNQKKAHSRKTFSMIAAIIQLVQSIIMLVIFGIYFGLMIYVLTYEPSHYYDQLLEFLIIIFFIFILLSIVLIVLSILVLVQCNQIKPGVRQSNGLLIAFTVLSFFGGNYISLGFAIAALVNNPEEPVQPYPYGHPQPQQNPYNSPYPPYSMQ